MSKIKSKAKTPGTTAPDTANLYTEAKDNNATGHMGRRQFLKALGLSSAGVALAGCDLPSYVTLEEGEEKVISYLAPDEYAIPGVGVWYASTCLQCAAGCSTHGRVREGRVLKLEGNPQASINKGRLCQMGQATLQTHFNPDRIAEPMVRKGGKLQTTTWDEALALVAQKSSGGANAAWVTGTISGHQRVLVETHLNQISGSSARHYAIEAINAKVWEAACLDILSDPTPELHIDKASCVVSFGADFLGTFISPVHLQTQYAEFRSMPRGVLFQIEPAMSMTGANADHWVATRPGGETAVALGIARELINSKKVSTAGVSKRLLADIQHHDGQTVAAASGVTSEQISKIATALHTNRPSLVLAGGPATGGSAGYSAAAAALLLNRLLGNIGKTITPGTSLQYPQLAARSGSTEDLARFATDAKAGKIAIAFINGTNPLYLAPIALGLDEGWNKIGFKVAFSDFMDETTSAADVVLPMASSLEDWGSHVAGYKAGEDALLVQQPLMEPVFANTRGFGDVVLALAKEAGAPGLDEFQDYYGYLRSALSALKGSDLEQDWNQALSGGRTQLRAARRTFSSRTISFGASGTPAPSRTKDQLTLVAAARQGMWDGRHANLTWLQEAPDQISKVVWDSWAEIHPKTAKRLGVVEGDYVTIATADGSVSTRVFIYKGVHPDAIAVPLGRGHHALGRWANGNGVNPLSILDGARDKKTGELATATTLVNVRKTGDNRHLAKLMEIDSQHGRKLAATIPASQQNKTEGGV